MLSVVRRDGMSGARGGRWLGAMRVTRPAIDGMETNRGCF